jgi:cell division GTPase FtsZ
VKNNKVQSDNDIANKLKNIILNNGENSINIDYSDLECVLEESSESYLLNFSVNINELEKQLNHDMISNAIENNKIKNILLNFNLNSKMELLQISNILEIIDILKDEDVSIIFGTTIDENIENDVLEVLAVIAI